MRKEIFSLMALTFCLNGAAQQKLTLHETAPAQFFEETFVLGNGNLGATVYGGVKEDRISLNDITLWTGEPDNKVYDSEAYKHLGTIRDYLNQENYEAAEKAHKALEGHYSENYQPLGQLMILDLNQEGEAQNYLRVLDIRQAVSQVTYQKDGVNYQRDYFVTAPDSAIVIRLKADQKEALNVRLSLSCQLPHTTIVPEKSMLYTDGYCAYRSYPSYFGGLPQRFYYDPDRGIHFRTILKVVRSDGQISGGDDGQCLEVKKASEILLVVSNVTSFNGAEKDPVKEGKPYKELVAKRIQNLSAKGYDQLLKAHLADYQPIFNRVELDLGVTDASISAQNTSEQLKNFGDQQQANPDLEELYFQYGRYLLISSSRTPNVPANLQGLWNEYMLPPWSSNYTSNINLEENYWAAETTNLPEMHQSLLGFIQKLQRTGNATARAYYAVQDGWCLAHNTDIWAMTNPVGEKDGDPCWACWNMGGAWVSTHLWEHYTFSMDKEYLAQVYPALKGAADFCMNWFVEKNGELVTSPSTSPENIYKTPSGFMGATLYGGTADLAMARECLIDALKAAKVLGMDAAYQTQIQKTLNKMHPYKIGKKGNLQEWYYDWEDQDPQHRHQSHLFGLYPGHQIIEGTWNSKNPSKEKLLKACAKTLEIKGDNTTGWSTGWRVNLYARLQDARGAYNIYRRLLKYISPDNYQGPDKRKGGGTYPNLLDAHSPFQIDGNFGGCAGVAEMLLQSSMSEIQLLPALPSAWSEGSVKGLCARGGLEVDMQWKAGKVTSLTLKARTAGSTKLRYNGKTQTVKFQTGQTLKVL